MLISVIYPNGKHDYVKDFYLPHLIRSEAILSFKRSSGWVAIASANIRDKNRTCTYAGPERRREETANTKH